MNAKRVYFIQIAILAIMAIGFFGGIKGISGLLQTPANNLTTLKAKVAALNQRESGLVQAHKDISSYNDLYQISQSLVPENKDEAETVRQIVNIANANNVVLQTIDFPNSSLGGSTTTTSSGTIVNSAGSAGVPSQLVKVTGIPGVYVLAITIDSDSKSPVSFPQLIGFLSGLEQNRLTAEVGSITISPSSTDSSEFDFSLTVNCYIKP